MQGLYDDLYGESAGYKCQGLEINLNTLKTRIGVHTLYTLSLDCRVLSSKISESYLDTWKTNLQSA